jgi:hypothetical protein
MAEREGQYDPYIPAGSAGGPAAGGTAPSAPGNQRTAALQAVSRVIYFSGLICVYLGAPTSGGRVYDNQRLLHDQS